MVVYCTMVGLAAVFTILLMFTNKLKVLYKLWKAGIVQPLTTIAYRVFQTILGIIKSGFQRHYLKLKHTGFFKYSEVKTLFCETRD